MRPRSELRVATKARERLEDLNPDLLCHVGGKIGIVPHQAPNDDVDVRRVAGPQGPHRRLIAGDGALYGELFIVHDVQRICHSETEKGCPATLSLRPCAPGSFSFPPVTHGTA